MVDQTPPPFPAQGGLVAARNEARVLQRDHRLVVVSVERPSLDLALCALTAVQQHMERVQAVIAPRADVAQLRLEGGGGRRPHRTPSIPSSATSHPLRSTCTRSGEPSIRIGLVLLMCT